jgi:hypothetical protein
MVVFRPQKPAEVSEEHPEFDELQSNYKAAALREKFFGF